MPTAARKVAIVRAANMSLGVNLCSGLVRQVAARLGDEYDIEILEMHHRHKVDAPSGTALALGRAAAEGRGIDLAAHSQRVRDGITGPRKTGDIGFAALRGGDVAGEHVVIFAGEGERIELTPPRREPADFCPRRGARGALAASGGSRGFTGWRTCWGWADAGAGRPRPLRRDRRTAH